FHAYGNPVGAFPLFPHLDKSGDIHIPRGYPKHRMRDEGALGGGGRKPECNCGGKKREGKPKRAKSKTCAHRNCVREKNTCPPTRRLLIDAEIKKDSAAETDREPRHQAAGTGLDDDPFAGAMGSVACNICKAVRPCPSWSWLARSPRWPPRPPG